MSKTLKIEITFTEPLLGTMAGNPEIAKEFQMAKHPEGVQSDEEKAHPAAEPGVAIAVENAAEIIQKSSTIFARVKGDRPALWDYQFKGFFKDACGMLNRVKKDKDKVKAHKKIIDGLIFVYPRQIPIELSGEITWLERPLRGQTAQGERIALARSEMAPAGSTVQIRILMLDEKLEDMVKEWLNYGAFRGLGQWRNASYGRFSYKIIA